jgi:hypothetical protein
VWHDWITRTYEVQAPFVGEQGHTYRFRARVWQKYPNGAHLYGPYRPDGDTRTLVAGPRLLGQVLAPGGYPLAGATVAISGTAYATTSGASGRYDMVVPSWSDPQTITVSHPRWLSPPPLHGVAFGLAETVAVTWTLRPPEDAILDGQFEAGLGAWSVFGEGPPPAVVTEPVHTGYHALALGAGLPMGGTTGVSQTLVLSGAWEPALSFWYHPVAADSDDLAFRVVVTVVTSTTSSALPPLQTGRLISAAPLATTDVFTPALEVGGWHHQWYHVGPPDAYLTGTVTVQFQVSRSGDEPVAVYLDEVSLGATPGGSRRTFLPLVQR